MTKIKDVVLTISIAWLGFYVMVTWEPTYDMLMWLCDWMEEYTILPYDLIQTIVIVPWMIGFVLFCGAAFTVVKHIRIKVTFIPFKEKKVAKPVKA